MQTNLRNITGILLMAIIIGIAPDTANAGSLHNSSAELAIVQQYADYNPSQELKQLLENDPGLKALVEKSIAMAAENNPDRITNPVQSLDEFYSFIDYSVTCKPWKIMPEERYQGFATKCDQSILYAYFLLDQPLTELEGKGLYYPSVEYLEPIYKWLTVYNNKWRSFLETRESWSDADYQMLYKDPTWNLDKGWYEDKSKWHSFNEFFSRKLSSPAARPVADKDNPNVVVSPADSLPQGVWQIDNDGKFLAEPIKNDAGVVIKDSVYVSVEQLLGEAGAEYAERFHGGILTHTYLNYDDYHRYHFPVGGKIITSYIVPYANAVGGIVYWEPEKQLYVLESNSLSWQAVETRGCTIVDTGENGLVAILPIGMGQVSSVNFVDSVKPGNVVKKGDELGFFLFGGSDCVMLFEKKANFKLTVPKGTEGGYSNGFKHVLCGEAYGRVGHQ